MDGVGYAMDLRFLLFITAACMLAGLIGTAAGIGLNMNILEKAEGHVAWFSLFNGPVQKFDVRWENMGSVNCLSRARIDFHEVEGNGSLGGRVYTSWSSQEPLMAGESHEWELYSALPAGSYAAVLRIYHCNEIADQEPYFFNVSGGGEPEDRLYIEVAGAHREYIDVIVSSPSGAGGVVVLPAGYPSGWIFQAGYAGDISPGGTATARLEFVPVRTDGAAISLRAVSGDGSAYGEGEFSVSLPEEEPVFGLGMLILLSVSIAVILAVVLYLSNYIIKIWRR